ncbi:MAG: DUF1801 domain-containing protein [Chloroflexota bacterium]
MDKIELFVQDIRLVSPAHAEVIELARQLFADRFPALEEKIIYGGVGFFYDGVHIGGIYPNKNYLNLAFSRGNELRDPNALLLGKGKFRRHLRLTSLESFADNKAAAFVSQYATLLTT